MTLLNIPKIFNILIVVITITLPNFAQGDIRFEQTKKTKPIAGYPPYMTSIGSMLELKNHTLFDENNRPITSVNSVIYIPSTHCQYSHSEIGNEAIPHDLLPFYHFSDRDRDECETASNANLAWYKLEVPQGQNWSDIDSWDQLLATQISTEYLVNSIPESLYSPALKIPADAVGHRIGFIYTPISKTGNPNEGLPIKVWDLDYFFGQQPYEESGKATIPNDGEKLSKINWPSGGGIVMGEITPPTITDLHMRGVFAIGESLEAKFNFIANTTRNYEEVSRLWWGKSGTTASLAYFSNTDYSTSHISPKLTANDIATVYEVSVLPIKKETGDFNTPYFVVGKSQTVKSDDPNNAIFAKHKIEDLTFTLQSQEIPISTELSATYTFNNGGDSTLIDHSTYTWRVYNPLTQIGTSSRGEIITSGTVPALTIKREDAGQIIELRVEAKDQLGRDGEEQTIRTQVEAFNTIDLSQRVVDFNFGDKQSEKITAYALYSAGSKIDVSSDGEWKSGDPDIVIDRNGNISIAPTNDRSKTVSASFSYSGVVAPFQVIINSIPPSVSNIQFVPSPRVGESIAVIYDFNHGGMPNGSKRLLYFWYIENSDGSLYKSLAEGEATELNPVPPTPVLGDELAGKWLVLSALPVSGEIGLMEYHREEIAASEASQEHVLTLDNQTNFAIAGEEQNIIQATVTDQEGNPIENINVDFHSDHQAVLLNPASAMTDSKGQVSAAVKLNTAIGGDIPISATITEQNVTERILTRFLSVENIQYVLAPQNTQFSNNSGFPTTGYEGATFQIIANNGIANSNFVWSSSDNNAAQVDSDGNVTLHESSLRRELYITAKNNQQAYRYNFRINNWFVRLPNSWTYDNAFNECQARGMSIPSRTQLSKGKNVRGIGSLWSEWHKPNGWLQALNSHHWSSTENSFRKVYVINIEDGDNSTIKGNDGAYREYGVCIK